MDFWEKIIFSDESKFEIFTPSSIRKIWRKNKTALGLQNVLPTLKYGGGNVMVWGCVVYNEAGNLAFIDNKMNALAYIDVYRYKLLDSAKKLSIENTFIFQQDNDPKHTAIVTKTWLLYHVPRRLEIPPQSPDLNPIENLWIHLDTEVRKKCNNDEAHFWLNGYVNKQNCRIWSEANPQVYVETPLHPEKLTVWCAVWAAGILLQKR
ncbi:transposable element Tcb2 transposase [Trichonephila clavipes]|nr:transposable element Tcb2 transposase [Trichonephila clavipes]